jgi:RNA ligase
MLKIDNINQLRLAVNHKDEIRESTTEDGYSIFCYMISNDQTFDDKWARECRGIVFDRAGKVVGRPLHKFFNVNERAETQVGAIDWSKVVRVMEKRDGSMIHTVRGDWTIGQIHGVRIKSKKSFDSDIAKAAWPHFVKYENFARVIAEMDCTAIFEFTAPDARIVLYYSTPELRLLHIRNNLTGEYWDLQKLREISRLYEVPLVDEVKDFWALVRGASEFSKDALVRFQVDWLLEAAKTRENIEGWVIQFENGDMVKMKTDWYLARHKAMTFLRERDIARMIIEESIDDLKSLLVGEGVDIAEINALESKVLNDVKGIETSLKAFLEDGDLALPRKDFAIKYKSKTTAPMFGLLMQVYSGKEPDYKQFFMDHMWKQNYTLRQLNLIPSKAEIE